MKMEKKEHAGRVVRFWGFGCSRARTCAEDRGQERGRVLSESASLQILNTKVWNYRRRRRWPEIYRPWRCIVGDSGVQTDGYDMVQTGRNKRYMYDTRARLATAFYLGRRLPWFLGRSWTRNVCLFLFFLVLYPPLAYLSPCQQCLQHISVCTYKTAPWTHGVHVTLGLTTSTTVGMIGCAKLALRLPHAHRIPKNVPAFIATPRTSGRLPSHRARPALPRDLK